jgi:hypothetical protein
MQVEQVHATHAAMVCKRMLFGEVIGQIVRATAPMDDELALGHAIAHPIEVHVNGLGATLFDGVVGNASGTGVVGLNGGGRLGVAHVGEESA